MTIFLIILVILLLIILIRLLFRKFLDLPNYSGELITQKINIENVLSEEIFWNIIYDSKKHSNGNYELQCRVLTEYLALLDEDDIIRFDRTFSLLMSYSYSYRLWEAAYSLNGGCSDDAFEYFRSWLIAQGKNKFYWTIKHPRMLFLTGVKELIEQYEGIAYCSREAFETKTGRIIPQHDDISYPDPGKIFNENTAILRYPELALLAW